MLMAKACESDHRHAFNIKDRPTTEAQTLVTPKHRTFVFKIQECCSVVSK